MSRAKNTQQASVEQTVAESQEAPAVYEPLTFEHAAPTEVKATSSGHAELHNVVGRAVSELQTVVADLHAELHELRGQVAASATPEPAGAEPAGSPGSE